MLVKPSVLLIVPTHRYGRVYPAPLSLGDFPVGPAYVASALKTAGHQVYGFNPNNITGYSSGPEMLKVELNRTLQELCPDVVGLGGLAANYRFLKDAVDIIHKELPSAGVVLGGGIANHDAEFIGPLLGVDACVRGDGEIGMVELLAEGTHGTPIIDGRIEDLDRLAFPDFELFNAAGMLDMSPYVRYTYRFPRIKPRVMSIVTARGCPFSCSFCVHRPSGLVPYRMRSIPNIMAEIKENYERYEFNILMILDELFAANKIRLREFCEAVMVGREQYGWDFNWGFQTHASAALDEAALKLAKEAGCYFFAYGLESSSPRVLASIGKRTVPEQIEKGVKLAESQRVAYCGAYIFGNRAENTSTISETISFFDKHLRNAHVYFGSSMPYPGSDDYDYCIEQGIIKNKAEYYERIDWERQWNMTKIPDVLWYPWAYLMGYLGARFGWVKAAKDGKCPHCGAPVSRDSTPPIANTSEPMPLWVKAWRLKVLVSLLLTWWHPMYMLLLPLLGRSKELAGCPSCGKRFGWSMP